MRFDSYGADLPQVRPSPQNLGQGCSHGRSAAQLGIHENTVRYRIRQCEDRLERTIGPEDFDLQAALVLVVAIPSLAAA